MRRRVQVEQIGDVPLRFLKFDYFDWADESEIPPPHWQGTVPEYRQIKAFQRWLTAQRAYRLDHRIPDAEWDEMRRRLGIGVVVDR